MPEVGPQQPGPTPPVPDRRASGGPAVPVGRGAVRVGLAGAGQWAAGMHAPLHSAGAETELVGIWSHTPARAAELAARHGVPAFEHFEDLVAASEAVDFAVPPAVQADLAVTAARAGRALMLEKPLGASRLDGERLHDAAVTAGVPTLVAFTRRYSAGLRDFLSSIADRPGPTVVSGRYAHGGLLPGGFVGERERTGWRADGGVLLDLGPHLLDAVDAAAGPVVALRASEVPGEAVLLETEHVGGARGQLVASGRFGGDGSVFEIDLFGHEPRARFVGSVIDPDAVWARIRAEFAAAVRNGTPPTVDVTRGLHVQRLLDAALRSLADGNRFQEVNACVS
ncbi:Predicted dehydrogenase [Curtobacterium sp. 314Chir4.1]|uniref:Gfo/Idh/MocA family protein n=1 Tax=Curtobacterium sp. 314Chir4.1 TaxID=1279028 RepID=UPI000BC8D001|nr:Gfo/Idh/MocA family oxidoreductase [Curtobacterium sp. 314Chir4.1]SOC89818.1 Predicted dehydrogenase [Curtobacterium sp. 314Chir4.1]